MKNELIAPPSGAARIEYYLQNMDQAFIPPISQLVNIRDYSNKIAANAHLIWVCSGEADIALCAFYANIKPRVFITSFSVSANYQGRGLGKRLMLQTLKSAGDMGFSQVLLEVNASNKAAVSFYAATGFQQISRQGNSILMEHSSKK